MSRSKRYKELEAKIDANKLYPLPEAISLAKETAKTSFDGTLELHVRLGIDISKSDQQVRGTVTLPHGTGKTTRVAVFAEEAKQQEAKESGAEIIGGEEAIEALAKSGKIDFDVAVATPAMMKHMAKVARVLGPKGLMPSPKNDTVTNDIKQIVSELKKGKLSFKNDATGNIHLGIGKISFTDEQLMENATAAIEAIKKAKPASSKGTYLKKVSLNATMGPGITITTV